MQQRLKIDGMTCQHCQRAVEQALSQVPGVDSVSVDLSSKIALVTGTAEPEALHRAVSEEGYASTAAD